MTGKRVKCVMFWKTSIEKQRNCASIHLEEVFNSVWVIAVALSADSLHFLDLACFAGSLDVLKVNIRLLTEIHNRSKEVKQTFEENSTKGQAHVP